MNAPLIWKDADELKRWKIQKAKQQSALASARIQGMKIRAQLEPPTAAPPGFPYPHRTCAEWRPIDAYLERRVAE